MWIDRGDHTDEHTLIRFRVLADDLQHANAVGLARQRHVEMSGVQLEEARQQLRVVHVGAVRGIAVASRTGVNADTLPLLGREPGQREVVQIDEALKQVARGIDLHRQPPFGEVDLHVVGASLQAAADLRLVLVQQVLR